MVLDHYAGLTSTSVGELLKIPGLCPDRAKKNTKFRSCRSRFDAKIAFFVVILNINAACMPAGWSISIRSLESVGSVANPRFVFRRGGVHAPLSSLPPLHRCRSQKLTAGREAELRIHESAKSRVCETTNLMPASWPLRSLRFPGFAPRRRTKKVL